jgi:transposase InsO family protein
MDIIYIRMARGFVYRAVVLDWCSRRVLLWRVSITMEAAFCVETLEHALARHGKPDIVNTDQGSQFTALRSRAHSIAIRQGRLARQRFVERLRSVKYEEVYLRAYDSVSEARTSIVKGPGRYVGSLELTAQRKCPLGTGTTPPGRLARTSPACPARLALPASIISPRRCSTRLRSKFLQKAKSLRRFAHRRL